MRALLLIEIGFVQHTLRRVFEEEGFTVSVATSPADALEKIRSDYKLDLVVCDWSFKGITALDVYRESTRIERLADDGDSEPPRFMILANPSNTTNLNGGTDSGRVGSPSYICSLGIGDVVVKPIDHAELRGKIATIIQARGKRPPIADIEGRRSSPDLKVAESQVPSKEAVHPRNAEQIKQLLTTIECNLKQVDALNSMDLDAPTSTDGRSQRMCVGKAQ